MKSASPTIVSRTSVRKSAVAVAGLLVLGASGAVFAAVPAQAAEPAVADGGGQGAHHRTSPQHVASPWSQFKCFSGLLEYGSGWNADAGNSGDSGHAPRAEVLPTSTSASAADVNRAGGFGHQPHGSPCAAGSFWQSHYWY